LSAAWFVTLLILEPTLLTAAASISKPSWAAGLLAASAVVMPVLVGVAVFMLQTKYRPEQMGDQPYSEHLKQKWEGFSVVGGQQALPPDAQPLKSERDADRGSRRGETQERVRRAREGYRLAYYLSRDDVYELHHGL